MARTLWLVTKHLNYLHVQLAISAVYNHRIVLHNLVMNDLNCVDKQS